MRIRARWLQLSQWMNACASDVSLQKPLIKSASFLTEICRPSSRMTLITEIQEANSIESRGVERRREYCMLWCTKTIISTARHSSSLRPTSSGRGPCCSVEGPSVGKRSFALAQPINSVLLQFPATFHSSPLGTPHQLKPLGVGLPASVGKSNKKCILTVINRQIIRWVGV